jgi:hypothetical protein
VSGPRTTGTCVNCGTSFSHLNRKCWAGSVPGNVLVPAAGGVNPAASTSALTSL